MKTLAKICFSVCLNFLSNNSNGQNPNPIIITSGGIILYVVDSVWHEAYNSYSYTSELNGRTKIEVDPGYHTLEFKYPAIGQGGRIYSATFFAENGKKYIIQSCDTNSYYPAIIDKTTNLMIKNAVIKQISIPKSDSNIFRLPNTGSNNFARVTTTCCKGLYNTKGEFSDLNSIISIFKIDEFWGPNSFFWNVGFKNRNLSIELPPGLHEFYIVARTPANEMYITTNIQAKKLRYGYLTKEVLCIAAVLEPGKSYGFDLKLCFNTPIESFDNYYFEIKIVEIPDS